MDGSNAPQWRRIEKRKVATSTSPVMFSAGDTGRCNLSFSPTLLADLDWGDDATFALDVCEMDDVVMVRLTPDPASTFKLYMPPAPKGKTAAADRRRIMQLGMLGGVELKSRKGEATEYEFEGEALILTIQREPTGVTGAGDAEDDNTPPVVEAALLNVEELAPVAIAAAVAAWNSDIEPDAKPVRIAAATALVEFGCDADEVRELLHLRAYAISQRDTLTPTCAKAATAAVDALHALSDD